MYDTDIYHFGVKGMKWGQRKRRESSSTGRSSGRVRDQITVRRAVGGVVGARVAGGLCQGPRAARPAKIREPEDQHDDPAQPGGPGPFPGRRPRLADPHRRDAAQGRWPRSLTNHRLGQRIGVRLSGLAKIFRSSAPRPPGTKKGRWHGVYRISFYRARALISQDSC